MTFYFHTKDHLLAILVEMLCDFQWQIMSLYGVPEEIREMKIKKVLALDYSGIGRRILREFMEYIDQASEYGLELQPQGRFKR